MILAFDTSDLPGEAITVILLLLFSFIGWLKKSFFDKPVEPPASMEDEEMREVIWRRQMGENSEETRLPWETPETPPPPIRFDQPEIRQVAAPATPPALPQIVEVSKREDELADAFGRSTRRKLGRRTSHRRQVDRLLSSPSAAKDAILLMEILGPPVGLKPEHLPET